MNCSQLLFISLIFHPQIPKMKGRKGRDLWALIPSKSICTFVQLCTVYVHGIQVCVYSSHMFGHAVYLLYLLLFRRSIFSMADNTFVCPKHRDAPEPTGEEGEDADMELPKVYEPVPDWNELKERLEMFLSQFNEMVRGAGMDLVFFPDAMLHIVKVRINSLFALFA